MYTIISCLTTLFSVLSEDNLSVVCYFNFQINEWKESVAYVSIIARKSLVHELPFPYISNVQNPTVGAVQGYIHTYRLHKPSLKRKGIEL